MGINKLPKMNYSPKDDEESTIFQRMVDLEQELVDFQQSSKELEEALEAELNELEEKIKLSRNRSMLEIIGFNC